MIPASDTFQRTVSGLFFTGRGLWVGYIVDNAHATDTGTCAFSDGPASGGRPLGTLRVAAGTSKEWLPGNGAARVESGLVATLTGGTLTVVAMFNVETRLLHELAMFDDGTEDLTRYGLLARTLELGGLQ